MDDWQSAEEPRKGVPAIPIYIWVLALVALALAALACGLWALYVLRAQHPLPGPSPTPIIWTATPQPTPTPGPTPTETAIPTPTLSPDIAVGRYVRVSGTEGAGVSLYIKRHMPERLDGKVIATNTTTEADVETFRQRGVRHLVTSTPRIAGRSFGTNVMEAALVAVVGKGRPLTPPELEEMICQLGLEPAIQPLNP